MCGESAAVNEQECNAWQRDILPDILKPFNENDIFNADETGLFYKCLPEKTITFKANKCHGGKQSKERVTCLLAANMSGTEKLKIHLIGKSENPRCFRGIKWLPVDYANNNKSWMTSDLFEKWLLKLDRRFLREDRKVLFLIDNCPAHPSIQHKLKAITLKFFPPNMTSLLQPLDQGVIKVFKHYYRRRILMKVLDALENNNDVPKITLLDCVKDVAATWNFDITKEIIHNCFEKAGLKKTVIMKMRMKFHWLN